MSARPHPRAGLWPRLRGDRRGVSAVEFALLAPVMIFLYFGLAEFCQGFMAQKRMGHASAMTADMVAQAEAVTGAGIDDIFAVGDLIMRPFPSSPLALRITSVTRDANGVAKVDWSRGRRMAALAPGESVSLPDGLIENGQTVIMSDAAYDYDSPVDFLMPSITRFEHRYYLRPRTVDFIPYAP